MNTQNLDYLQKQLLNLGFGEELNQNLEKHVKENSPEFSLMTTKEYNQQKVDYTLNYKRGQENEMYFFNSYKGQIQGKEMQQTFYVDGGITAKEAYNLMDGRAVYKQMQNQDKQKYNAWLTLDTEGEKTKSGNYKLRPFTEGWNYKPERAIEKMDIVGINEPGARDKLMQSLQKGNRHQVTAMKNGKEVKLFIEANPADHRVNLTNYKGEAQRLDDYKKPEAKQDKSQDKSQKQEQDGTKKKRQPRLKTA